MEFPTDRVTDPQYEKMVSIPEDEIKSGNKYYGFVYYGIAPLDCKEILIDGKQAELQKMSYNINVEKADFIFYYCIIESDNNEEKDENYISPERKNQDYDKLSKSASELLKLYYAGITDEDYSKWKKIFPNFYLSLQQIVLIYQFY